MPQIDDTDLAPNHALTEALVWISKFAHAWKAIEPVPRSLNIDGFIIWGPVLYEKHNGEDPVLLAQQLFGKPGPYAKYLYPARKPTSGANLAS